MLGIDAARGTAMLFSCLAHFGWWIEHTHPRASSRLSSIGMIATPTFLLLSGVVTGWLCRGAAERARDTQWKLFNRGLFLLTLGHVLVTLAEAHRDGLVRALLSATIIDDIGLCILCCALSFTVLRREEFRRPLLGYAVAGYLLCWLVILIWHPSVGGWLVVHQALLGTDPLGASMHTYSSPLMPYICLFAIGVGSSNYIVAAARVGAADRRWKRLLTLGFALIASALALRILGRWAEREFGNSEFLPLISSTLTIGGKLPPAPAYVLFYCGAGVIVSCVTFALAGSSLQLARRAAEVAAVLGRASLFVFILQYFIFWTLPDILGVTPGNTHLVLIFIGGLSVNWLAAWCWNRMRGNRLLTLGIKPPARRSDRDGTPPHDDVGGYNSGRGTIATRN